MRYTVLVLAAVWGSAGAHAQTATPQLTAECSKWSIKGMRVGMPLKEVKRAHENLKHGRNWFRPDDKGRRWYFWAENRMKGLYNYVLPERDDPAARILSVMALLDTSESDPATAIDALVERWGPPSAREVPIGTVRYFNVFGAPRGEFDWLATTWEDNACDVLVTLLDKTKMPPIGSVAAPFKEVTLSIDSISGLVEAKERERNNAREAVRP